MKQLKVFHRIFCDDLKPTKELTHTRREEYIEFLSGHQNLSDYEIPLSLESCHDLSIQFYYCKLLVSNAMKAFKEDLYLRIFVQGTDSGSIKDVVHRNQAFIEMHLNKILEFFLPPTEHAHVFDYSENRDSFYDIFKLVYQQLVGLEEYLEKTFSGYLDQTTEIPCKQRKKFIEQQRPKAERVLNHIQELEIDGKVKKCLTSAINCFLEDGFNRFNRVNKVFGENFFQVMDTFFTEHQKPILKDDLVLVLMRVNFNRHGMSIFLINIFRKALDDYSSKKEKLDVLHKYLSMLHQIEVRPLVFYHPKVLSLKKQCIEWLIHEKKLLLHGINDQVPLQAEIKEIEQKSTRLLLNLTVSDVSLILRLIDESKILAIKKAYLFKIFAPNFRTKRSGELSAESLWNNSYNIPDRTRKKIKTLLKEMLFKLEMIE